MHNYIILLSIRLCIYFTRKHVSFALQRRRKSLKSGPWTGSSAMINKELSSFLGSSTNSRANINEAAPDPILSPFLGGASHSHSKGSEQNESCNSSAQSARYASHYTCFCAMRLPCYRFHEISLIFTSIYLFYRAYSILVKANFRNSQNKAKFTHNCYIHLFNLYMAWKIVFG